MIRRWWIKEGDSYTPNPFLKHMDYDCVFTEEPLYSDYELDAETDNKEHGCTEVIALDDLRPLLERCHKHLADYGSGKGIGTDGITTMKELSALLNEDNER